MKFSEIPYLRPAMDAYESKFSAILEKFENGENFDQQDKALQELYEHRDNFDTMYQLANIKYTTNTANEAFQKEVNFFNEVGPVNEKLVSKYYKTLLNAKHKNQLEGKWGEHIFNLASLKVKGFDPTILEEMKQENKLKSEYVKVKGTAKIEFEGQTLNLAGIGKYTVDKDRSIRKKASEARWKFFADNREKIDDIYDRLVKLRHNMAQKLGYKNFIDLGYIRMERLDYDKQMVQNFRRQVVDNIVPIAGQLRERQRRRLGYDKLHEYDMGFNFTSGNPKPKGTPKEILGKAKKMYKDLSAETGEFFDYMLDHDLMDVINRPGKADAGYCWELSAYKHPFIFANFNGTAGDIDVLTHEAGHAFQYFCSRKNNIIEYRWPSSEACEIHSMSMEFLTYPWMKDFFEEDADKYFFSHLNSTLLFLPYGCAVDHFQHIIYENPHFTADERAEAWQEMEAMYIPDRNHQDSPFLKNGRFWHRQGHIFEEPFYYIDYTLAQICAYQFWQKNNEDKAATWGDYLRLCKAGGTSSFLDLVKLAKLQSPFDDGCVKKISAGIKSYLDGIDDSKF